MSVLLALLLTVAPSPTPASAQVEPVAAGEALAAAFEKTTARVDAEIASEIVNGGYRIGLVLGAGNITQWAAALPEQLAALQVPPSRRAG